MYHSKTKRGTLDMTAIPRDDNYNYNNNNYYYFSHKFFYYHTATADVYILQI